MSWRTIFFSLSLSLVVNANAAPKYKKGQLIIRLKKSTPAKFMANFASKKKTLSKSLNLHIVKLKPTLASSNVLKRLRKSKHVLYAQRDHYVSKRVVAKAPNDDLFNKQWGLNNNYNNASDINAMQAWSLVFKNPVRLADNMKPVIAIVDGGVDPKHEDLKDNMWKNSDEIPGNNIDDDGNGYVDDIYGWNAGDNNGKIWAGNHGTHVGGIAGARGGNKVGVSGVNPRAKIMTIIYDGPSGSLTSRVLASYSYAYEMKKLWLETKGKKGANVVATNSSFGVDRGQCDSAEYAAWNDIYNKMGSVGILSVAATANANWNIDEVGDVPTGCSSDYVFSVTNSTDQADRSPYAGYGKTTIDIAAPGTNILATLPNNAYEELTGTSMSTPHVTGAISLMHLINKKTVRVASRKDPKKFALYVKKTLMQTVRQNGNFKGKTVSGGILDIEAAAKKIISDMN